MKIVLRVTSGPCEGQEFAIDQGGTYVFGRSSRVTFPMPSDLLLSREHFQIENAPPVGQLIDLGSTNGTKVNGLRVERVLIRAGDTIEAGDSVFTVQVVDQENDGLAGGTCAGCG